MVAAEPDSTIDVVICTHDNADALDVVLDALARQQMLDGWRVTVVENACTDHTASVVDAHRQQGSLPSLRRIVEPTLGLTPARLRGVRETHAPWIAFVDDDCVVDDGWVAAVRAFAAANPGVGGFGGRVLPVHERQDPLLDEIGWAFAEQDHGTAAVEVDSIVGAGMVLRRAALEASGWTRAPLLADRTGRRVISGGDVEIAQRIRATGATLWFTPSMTISHRIAAGRTTPRRLRRLVFGLGVCESRITALTWPGGRRGWLRRRRHLARDTLHRIRGEAASAFRHRTGRRLVLVAAYEFGRWTGVLLLLVELLRGRSTMGAAAPRPVAVDGPS